MNLPTRDQRAILIGAAALALILGLRFIAVPIAQTWQGARARISRAQTELESLKAQIADLQTQHRQLAPVFGPSVSERPPSAQDARVRFVKTVVEPLESAGLDVPSTRTQPLRRLREVSGVGLVTIQVRAVGDLPKLAETLGAMRQTDQLILVESLSASTDEEDPGDLEISMVLATTAQWEEAR